MPIPLDAPEILNREFLEIRARLLHLAAAIDRLSRAEGSVAGDPRLAKIREALDILAGDGELPGTDSVRAERIQLLFSRTYDPAWQQNLLGRKTR